MKAKLFWIAVLFAVSAASPAVAAVQPLSGLTNPTLQTLIDLDSIPVSVGGIQFSNFAFVDALADSGVTAAQIHVQPFTTGGGGLQFVSSWFAGNGTFVDELVSFNVQGADPAQPIGQISLLSNGTAPVPTTGTFTTTTLVSQLPNGSTAAPVISTYDDGVTTPVDITKPDIDYAQTTFQPQVELHIIDTVFESSSASGLATESVVQNAFATVPEPRHLGGIVLAVAGFIGALRRRRVST